jgi:hypothetical protein
MVATLGADMAAVDEVAATCRAVVVAPRLTLVDSPTEGVFLKEVFLPPWAPLVAPWVHPLIPQEAFKVKMLAVLLHTVPPQ